MKLRAAVLFVCLASPGLAQDAVGTRIAQSAAAAERMQGPLDGTWALMDARGRTLFTFQIGDPPTGRGRLSCAWRAPDGALGPAACGRNGSRLVLAMNGHGSARAALARARGGVWRGELRTGGTVQRVTLRRR